MAKILRHFCAKTSTQTSNSDIIRHGIRPILLTCEHASNDLPAPYGWGKQEYVRHEHWAYDPGAKAFTDNLVSKLQCTAVLSRYSRLFVDVNRHLSSDTLMRRECDGVYLDINASIDDFSLAQRLTLYADYHRTLGQVARSMPVLTSILSLHSFNPVYEGSIRDFEVGVLCTDGGAIYEARVIAEFLNLGGFKTKVNAPWSGQEGFMYSADSVRAALGGKPMAIMIELRNDKAQDAEWLEAFSLKFVEALRVAQVVHLSEVGSSSLDQSD